ncbi:hypothetical protein Tco_0688451 [Tanacetum coccineum]
MEPSPSLDTLSDDTTSTSSPATTTTTKYTHTPSTQTLTLQDIHFLKKLGSCDIGSSIYSVYADDYISRSTKKCLEENLDVLRTWLASQEIIRFCYLKDSKVESEASVNPDNAITYVDNSKSAQDYVMLSSAEVNFDNTDVIPLEFDDTAHTFINIPVKNYPFIITFQKFLLMLDGTLESSFFERFRKACEDCHVLCDARNRHCLSNADVDESLKMIIIAAMKELKQLDDLVNGNSILFKHAKWKVLTSDKFRRSFGKLIGSRLKRQNLDVSRNWLSSQEIIRFHYLKDFEVESEASVNPDNAINYVDNCFDIGIQEKKAKLFNEWEMFTSTDGELIESYYHRFSKLMNDFKRNKHFPKKIASNIKFLNNLQPEWRRHVTIVHQTKDLHTADYTQLYDFLKYNQKEVDELRAERLGKTHDLLDLMATSNYLVSHQDQPSPSNYIQQPLPNNNYNPQPSFNMDIMQQPMPNPEDISDPTTTMNMALALIAKAFKLNYSTPTNNNQRISSNP